MTKRSIITMCFGLAVAVFLFVSGAGIIDTNKSGEFVIKQAAWTGKMSAITKEGVFGQFWGDMYRYPRSHTYYFSAFKDEGGVVNESIPVTFKNGSQGTVSGSVRYGFPVSNGDKLINIHRRFRSPAGVRDDLVRTELRKLVSITASLMSPEAAMTQKGLFLQKLTDQINNGQYETEAGVEQYTDPISKEVRFRDVVNVVTKNGVPVYMENPFAEWGVRLTQVVVQKINPDPKTIEMIKKRRDAQMQVMVAKAAVEKAEQEKLRVEAEGKKLVAEKRYAALQAKETATVDADRKKQVAEIAAQQKIEVAKRELEAAKLDRKKAEQEKLAKIERGTGDAEARKLVMAADGALDRKLQTYERVMALFAKSYATRKVPTIVSGGSGDSGDASMLSLLDLFGYKVAKDLALDMELGENK